MFIFVNSFEEAEKYPVLFGTSECFMDNNVDQFYLKSVDQMGKYTMSTYSFTQIENPRPINPQDIATQQKQIADLSAKMDIILNALGGVQSQPQQAQAPAQPVQPAPQQPTSPADPTEVLQQVQSEPAVNGGNGRRRNNG